MIVSTHILHTSANGQLLRLTMLLKCIAMLLMLASIYYYDKQPLH